jgi:hypothetical protein
MSCAIFYFGAWMCNTSSWDWWHDMLHVTWVIRSHEMLGVCSFECTYFTVCYVGVLQDMSAYAKSTVWSEDNFLYKLSTAWSGCRTLNLTRSDESLDLSGLLHVSVPRKENSVFNFKPFFFSFSDVGENGDAPFIRKRIGKENRASYVVSINSSKNHWFEPARDINDCLSVLRFAAHFATRTNRAIKDLFASSMDLTWLHIRVIFQVVGTLLICLTRKSWRKSPLHTQSWGVGRSFITLCKKFQNFLQSVMKLRPTPKFYGFKVPFTVLSATHAGSIRNLLERWCNRWS